MRMGRGPGLRVLVTGANGFIGRALIKRLARETSCSSRLFCVTENPICHIRAAVRQKYGLFPDNVDQAIVDSLSADTKWKLALEGVDVIAHAAARVHVMSDGATAPLAEFRRINVAGTLNLACQAANLGVKRFVFLSSIKVNGEFTEIGKPFCADEMPDPQDPYSISKLEAEQGLIEIAKQTGMEVAIIRPPLVYGPGVKGNFLSMIKWLQRGIPMPFGAIHNKRSLVALDNVVDLILTCFFHPAASNQVFLAGDGEDISTTQLLRRLGTALGRPARLLPVPVSLLFFAAALLHQQDKVQRLCGSLQVDIEKTRTLLGWCPPITVDEGLRRVAEGFLG